MFLFAGELLGFEYLYSQTGKVKKDYEMTIAKSETGTVKETDEDEGLGKEVEDMTTLGEKNLFRSTTSAIFF